MDERLLSIVKAVALDTTAYCDDWGNVNCVFCSASSPERSIAPDLPEITKHDDGCKVTLARIILKELGTPVCIYKVEFEMYGKHIERSMLATSEQEVIQEYKLQHNVRVTFMREVQEKEGEHERG